MATTAEIRQRVFDYLYGSFPTESPFVTQITASYTAGATTINVLNGTQWEVNDIGENPVTGEQFLVLSIAANALTVSRGWAGTTAADSSGAADLIYKNPRFSQKKVDDGIATALRQLELWGIHVFGQGTITRADPKEFYELTPTDIIPQMGVLRVFEVLPNSEVPVVLPFRYQFSLGTGPATLSDTGMGVHIGDWGQTKNTEAVHFIYAQRIEAVADLLPRQDELAVLGAVVVLLGGTIIPATHDPGARTDRTVQPGQTSRDVRHFQGRFISECRMEAAQLTVERQKMLHEPVHFARARRWSS
jgi:hypothetical protein